MRLRKPNGNGLAVSYMPLIMLVSAVGAITSIPFAGAQANATAEPAQTVTTTEATVSETAPAPSLGAAPFYDSMVVNYSNDTANAIETYIAANPDATSIPVAEIRTILEPVRSGWVNGANISIFGTPNDFCVHGSHAEGTQYTNNNNWENGRPYYLYSSKDGGVVIENTGVTAQSCYSNPQRL